MQVEIYQAQSAETIDPYRSSIFEKWEQRVDLVRELGLSAQQKHLEVLEKAREVPFKLLSPEERRIWRRFLPARFLEDAAALREGFQGRLMGRWSKSRLTDYNDDLIPVSVLEAWQHCRQMGYFESYEIWTPREDSDPVLIGQLGPLTFLIARWGESLMPFEEIKREMEELRRRQRRIFNPELDEETQMVL